MKLLRLHHISISLMLSLSLFYSNSAAASSASTQALQQALTEPTLRKQLGEFIDNVLYQFPSSTLFSLAAEIENPNSIYEELAKALSTMRPAFRPYSKLRALRRQQGILQEQALQLLADKTTIRSCLEIGTPATYASTLQKSLKITGITYAVLEQRQLGDRLQAYSYNPFRLFKAYDTYVPLADYEPIPESLVPSNSVDLVICFIGLHHIPTDKLDAYIQSIQRVLRPGGIFLLRDHDVDKPAMNTLVDAAHSIFNLVVSETPVAENQREIRNFRSIDAWINILATHGFTTDNKRFLQAGDTTHNTMMRFEKQARTEEERLMQQTNAIAVPAVEVHSQGDSFLPTPEWFAVDASQEYGDFVNHTPFYRFPYFSYVATYWKLFGKSWLAASKRSGHLKTLTSEATLLNAFVGLSTTIEYTAKGLVALPIRFMYRGQEPEPISMLIHDPQQECISDSRLTVLEKYDNHIYRIRVPRHKEFLSLITSLATIASTATIRQISGQEEIQCKVRYPASYTPSWSNCSCEYTWQLPTKSQHIYAAISVNVKDLFVLITQLHDTKVELMHLHDF